MPEAHDLDTRQAGKGSWTVYDRRFAKGASPGRRLGWVREEEDGTFSAGGEGGMYGGETSGNSTFRAALEVFIGYD